MIEESIVFIKELVRQPELSCADTEKALVLANEILERKKQQISTDDLVSIVHCVWKHHSADLKSVPITSNAPVKGVFLSDYVINYESCSPLEQRCISLVNRESFKPLSTDSFIQLAEIISETSTVLTFLLMRVLTRQFNSCTADVPVAAVLPVFRTVLKATLSHLQVPLLYDLLSLSTTLLLRYASQLEFSFPDESPKYRLLSFTCQFVSIEVKSVLDSFQTPPSDPVVQEVLSLRYHQYFPLFIQFLEGLFGEEFPPGIDDSTAYTLLRSFQEVTDVIVDWFHSVSLSLFSTDVAAVGVAVFAIRLLGLGLKDDFDRLSEGFLQILPVLCQIPQPRDTTPEQDFLKYLIPGFLNCCSENELHKVVESKALDRLDQYVHFFVERNRRSTDWTSESLSLLCLVANVYINYQLIDQTLCFSTSTYSDLRTLSQRLDPKEELFGYVLALLLSNEREYSFEDLQNALKRFDLVHESNRDVTNLIVPLLERIHHRYPEMELPRLS